MSKNSAGKSRTALTLPALAVLVMCGVLISLGRWQLHRADEKRQLHQAFQQSVDAPRLELEAESLHQSPPPLWREATLHGNYREETLLLDNRVREGRQGYEVFTPYLMAQGKAVLVDRGWVPAPERRELWPGLPGLMNRTAVNGRIAPPPSMGIRLGNAQPPEPMGEHRWRVQRLEMGSLSATLKLPLQPWVLLLDPDEQNGFERRWILPAPEDGKHLAYAVQWFAMAALLPVLAWRRLRRKTPHQGSTNAHEE